MSVFLRHAEAAVDGANVLCQSSVGEGPKYAITKSACVIDIFGNFEIVRDKI